MDLVGFDALKYVCFGLSRHACLGGKRSGVVNLTPLSRTHETQALIGDLQCVRAKSGSLVVVALEIPIEEQTSLDNFMASEGSDADQAVLPASRFWTRQPQDGRTIAVMLKRLHRLRTLRAEGARISVLTIDDGMPRSRDADMVMHIKAPHSQGVNVVALLGNVRASHEKGRRSLPDYEPAG